MAKQFNLEQALSKVETLSEADVQSVIANKKEIRDGEGLLLSLIISYGRKTMKKNLGKILVWVAKDWRLAILRMY